MELRVLTSPGDGVGPAVMLDLDAHTQYMFRTPEGISRLALEHGQRPGLGLRAVFAWDSAASQVGGVNLVLLAGEGMLPGWATRPCRVPCPFEQNRGCSPSACLSHL